MAKELPYFKFEPGQWDNGKIQLCTFEEQGIYINLCSLYWQRLGKLPYKLALQKICGGNATALESLCREEIIAVIDGDICIDFLNEQLSEFHNASNTNSKNALSGWEKRRKNATALPSHSDPNAIREEKRREEEIREDEIKQPLRAREKKIRDYDLPAFEGELLEHWLAWEIHRKEKKAKLTPSTARLQIKFLGGRAPTESVEIIKQSIKNGWTGLFELKSQTNDRTTTKKPTTSASAQLERPTDWGTFD